jgi:hypothetical protein
MKSSVFWDITPSSPLKINRRFGGTCRLHLGLFFHPEEHFSDDNGGDKENIFLI